MPAPDYTDKFNTQLTPQQEQAFQNWAIRNQKMKDLFDYDLRGAFKAGVAQDPRGHLPDTFKKPNHPTFSSESMYSNAIYPGGDWIEQGNKWLFRPSPLNIQMHGILGLQDYFRQQEPDSELFLPQLPQ